MVVRRATLADLPTLLEFEQGVIGAERPFDPTLQPDPIRYYDFDKLLGSPHIEVVVAVAEDAIIGSGYARIDAAEPFLMHRSHAYLGFIYVTPSHRGRGVSRLLIDALATWATQHGVTELRLEVYAENQRAIRAYEHAGFAAHILTMRRG